MPIQKPVIREAPEQTFFKDTAIDRLMAYVFSLSAETYVLRDRIMRLEEALAAKGVLAADASETLVRSPKALELAAQDRARFVNSLMENLAGRQKSNSLREQE